MASFNFETSGNRTGYRIQFRDGDKRKRSIWLGAVDEAFAKAFFQHFEHLLLIADLGTPPESATTKWLAGLNPKFRDKLANVGLAESSTKQESATLTLNAWLLQYMSERKDVKAQTLQTYQKAADNLVTHFGKRKALRTITVTDAKKWRIWLATEGNRRDKRQKRTSMADETVRRRTGMAKMFFDEAVERGLIASNPFSGLPSSVRGNEKRLFFVPAATIVKCIEAATCVQWRTILALARFGGLRCPSEVLSLEWRDVNFAERRLTIRATKTEHHKDRGIRFCPIFPELLPYLEEAQLAAEDDEFVISRYRSRRQNLRSEFTRLITRVGVKPWPRLFQNLRASRETELMAEFPAKDVASWIGNSVPVAMKHYAMATDESFQRAIDWDGGSAGGSKPAIPSYQPETVVGEKPQENEGLIAGDSSSEREKWAYQDSNLGPRRYQRRALTN